jgi:hypothetical protein
MALRNLRWLVFLAPLGLLAVFPPLRPLWFLGTFVGYSVFWHADERNEQNLGRAAVVAYTVTLLGLAIALGLFFVPQGDLETLNAHYASLGGWALIVIYLLHTLTFPVAYIYYESIIVIE